MLFIAQNRKNSSHSFMSEAADAVERPASPGQSNPLSLQSYHQSMSSPVLRKVLPKPSPRGLSLHDLFAAAVGGLLIAPTAWAGADFQDTDPANNDAPVAAPIQADTRVVAKPDTESILSGNPNLVAQKSDLLNNTSFQAIVLQWTGPNGKQWVVPLSFDGVTSVPAIKINKPLAMIGVENTTDGLKPETPTDNTVAVSNLPALRHTTWPMDSTNTEDQPKL